MQKEYKEYIEREKIGLTDFEIVMCNGDYKDAFQMLLDKIENIPAADVRPVVLCGECKFWDRERISCEGLARCNTGESGIRYRNRNDFCSRGERRNEQMTNADRIRAMSDEELAAFFAQQGYRKPVFDGWLPLCDYAMGSKICPENGCKDCWLT